MVRIMKFTSPTDGTLDINQTYQTILDFIESEPDNQYRLIIGTDSQPRLEEIVFVTAIVIYRVGRGGRFFFIHKEREKIYT